MPNLVEPITWEKHQRSSARRFIANRVCALCGSDYVLFDLGDGFQIDCPVHGPAYAHQHISRNRYNAAQFNAHMTTAAIEAEDKPRRKPEEILHELGF